MRWLKNVSAKNCFYFCRQLSFDPNVICLEQNTTKWQIMINQAFSCHWNQLLTRSLSKRKRITNLVNLTFSLKPIFLINSETVALTSCLLDFLLFSGRNPSSHPRNGNLTKKKPLRIQKQCKQSRAKNHSTSISKKHGDLGEMGVHLSKQKKKITHVFPLLFAHMLWNFVGWQ